MTGGNVKKLAALACIALGCGGHPPSTAKAPAAPPGQHAQALYDRLGGQRAIVAVVDDFIGRVAADTRINLRFSNTDIPRLK